MSHIQLIETSIKEELKPCVDSSDPYEWARFGFHVANKILMQVRNQRFSILGSEIEIKSDGSPVTNFENKIETRIMQILSDFSNEANFYGEEHGNTNPDKKIMVAVDPIDGTWSFISGYDSYTVTLSISKGSESLFSLIASPATGDISYRIGTEDSMIFQFQFKSHEINPVKLPLIKDNNRLLVNIHPSKNVLPIFNAIHKKWEDGTISLVKSVSGSPALQILETAKTGTIYINSWDLKKSQPFDLLAAIHILNGADGHAISMDGIEINPESHKGIFICGLDKEQQKLVINILNDG